MRRNQIPSLSSDKIIKQDDFHIRIVSNEESTGTEEYTVRKVYSQNSTQPGKEIVCESFVQSSAAAATDWEVP